MKKYVDNIKALQIYGYRIEKIFKENGVDLDKMLKKVKKSTDEKKLKKRLYNKYYNENENIDLDKMFEYAERYIYFQYRIKELKAEMAAEKYEKMKKDVESGLYGKKGEK